MAGAMVSASTGAMNSLLGKLATLMGEEYGKLKGVRKEVASLQDEFSSIKALLVKLADMDELDAPAKEWRNQVKDMSYDIEDCIDDFMHHIGKNDDGDIGFVKKTARQLKKIRARHQIASKIQEIKTRLNAISERRTRYKLDEYTPKQSYVPVDPRVVAIHTEAANLVGMNVPREELMELVTGEEQELKVVSIVGFGGLGKTTLANQVYRGLEGQFECKTFVSVSQKPDIPKLLNKILLNLGGRVSDTGDLDDLENIRKHLRDKRYFIVIDDLWDSSAWKIIECAFPKNNCGSRLLITTRIYDVALACCSYNKQNVYNMRPLGKENSRRLFFNRIFGPSQACPDALEELSTDILKKCGGLPLAIISISSLLSGQPYSKWEYVRNSLGSMFEGNPNLGDMMWILDLSYKNLSHHLKTCLLYTGMYPEDHVIRKDDLLRQWIAEGFVSAVRGLNAEEVAGSYFNELVNMSMLQPVHLDYNDEVLSCRVHDIMLDLIRVKSAEENFIYVIDDMHGTLGKDKARRVSLHHAVATGQIPKTGNGSVSQVRSFVAFTGVSIASLEAFKYIRVLHFELFGCYEEERKKILNVICGLFLLRYLKIESFGDHLELPSQLCGLRYLETMDIQDGIWKPRTVPLDIVHLHRLSHLTLDGSGFRCGIGTLKSLCTLKGFDISRSSLDSVRSLGELTNLRNLYMCSFGDHVDDMSLDALQTSLERLAHSSNNLKTLVLSIHYRDRLTVRPNWLITLSAIPRKLQRLHIRVRLSRIPKWISQLQDLRSLILEVDKVEAKDDDIGILAGLPSLADLYLDISGNQEERIVIANTDVAFPALRHLRWRFPAEPLLAFEAGDLPRLQTIRLGVTAARWENMGKWLGPVGMEHLPAGLKKIVVQNLMEGRPDKATESALRSMFTMHHPGVEVTFD